MKKVVRCKAHVHFLGFNQEYLQIAEYEKHGQLLKQIEVKNHFGDKVGEEFPAKYFEDTDKTEEQWYYERMIAEMNTQLFHVGQSAESIFRHLDKNKDKITTSGTEVNDLILKMKNIHNQFTHGHYANRSTEDEFFK